MNRQSVLLPILEASKQGGLIKNQDKTFPSDKLAVTDIEHSLSSGDIGQRQ